MYIAQLQAQCCWSVGHFSCWSSMFVWSALPTSLSALTHVGRLLSPVLSPECCPSVGSPRRSLVATAIAATVYLGVGDLYRLASPPIATLRSSCCYSYFAAMWSPTPAWPSPHPLSAFALPRRRRALCCNVRSATLGATVDVLKFLFLLPLRTPFVCPFCVKSSVVSLSSLSNRLSALECNLSRLSCKLDSISAAPSCNVVSSTISPPSPSSPPLTYSAPPRSTSSILPLPPPLVPLRTSGLRPFHLPLVLLQLPWLLLLFFHSYCSWFCPPCCSCFPSFFRCYCFTFFCHYSL